jgi:hypothetical protein
MKNLIYCIVILGAQYCTYGQKSTNFNTSSFSFALDKEKPLNDYKLSLNKATTINENTRITSNKSIYITTVSKDQYKIVTKIPCNGTLYISDFKGNIVLTQPFDSNKDNFINFISKPGLYIANFHCKKDELIDSFIFTKP